MGQKRSPLALMLLLMGFLPVFLFGSPSTAEVLPPAFWFHDEDKVQAVATFLGIDALAGESTTPTSSKLLWSWWSEQDPAYAVLGPAPLMTPAPQKPVDLSAPREIPPPSSPASTPKADPSSENPKKQEEKKTPSQSATGKKTTSQATASTSPKTPSGPDPETGFVALPLSGPGFYHYNYNGNDNWGTPDTVATLKEIGRIWKERHPNGPLIPIGDLSRRQGGNFPPHASHKTGKDVDISILTSGGQYSRALTQEVIDLFWATGKISVIFYNDSKVKGVQPWPGHDDHFHVRFQ